MKAKRKKAKAAHGCPCPKCGSASTVVYARGKDDSTFRVRSCGGCGHRFPTLEVPHGTSSYTGVITLRKQIAELSRPDSSALNFPQRRPDAP